MSKKNIRFTVVLDKDDRELLDILTEKYETTPSQVVRGLIYEKSLISKIAKLKNGKVVPVERTQKTELKSFIPDGPKHLHTISVDDGPGNEPKS